MSTKAKDFMAGVEDAKMSILDKWYRYNRADGGVWYNRGWQYALEMGLAYRHSDRLTILEANKF